MSDLDIVNYLLKPVKSEESTSIVEDKNDDDDDNKYQQQDNNDDNDDKKDELDMEELLTEAFVHGGYLRKFMENRNKLIKRLGTINDLISMNKGKFGHILIDTIGISMNSAIKIYEIIQYNIGINRLESIEEMDENELNTISMHFESGHYDELSSTYRISLKYVQIISSNNRTRSATIEFDKSQIENFIIKQNSVQNPLIILLGISEYDGINCCQQLIDVKYDMIGLRRLFQSIYGYTVYQRNDRMYWRAKQIIDFLHYVVKNKLIHHSINKLKEEFDGVIVCISSYFKNNHIYSSDEHAINIQYIYQIFGEIYPALLSLPRLFIINTYPINTNYFYHSSQIISTGKGRGRGTGSTAPIRSSQSMQSGLLSPKKNTSKKRLSRTHSAYKPTNSKLDVGQRRMTIFGQSYHGNRLISYNKYNFENNGCSLFYRSVIQSFKQFLVKNGKNIKNNKNNKNNKKNKKYTPYLSEIVDSIKSNLKTLYLKFKHIQIEDFNNYNLKFDVDSFEDVELEPYIYRIGDIQFMNNIKYNKWIKKEEEKKEDEKECEIITEFNKNKKIVVYLYKDINTKQYYNVSNLSLIEINSRLLDGKIEAQIPIETQIKDIQNYNDETLYILKNNINIRLRSIGGIDSKCYRHKMYGDQKKASSEYRYLKVCVRNESQKYVLCLDCNKNGSYLNQCEFLEIPTYTNLPYNYEHSYFMVGLNGEYNQFYDSMAKLGVIGGLQYIVKDINSGKDTNMRFVCLFKGIDPKNNMKDLQHPIIDCLYCDKAQVNFIDFISNLNDNRPKKRKQNIDCKNSEIRAAFFKFAV